MHHRISGVVAKTVIEALEMVYVEHQAGEILAWLLNMPVQFLIKRPAVQETRQGVLSRHADQSLPKLEICDGKADILGEEFQI